MDAAEPVIRRSTFNLPLLALIATAAVSTFWLIWLQQNILVISSIYLVIAQLYLGYFLLANNPRSPVNISFGCFAFSLATWNALSILVINAPRTMPLFWADWCIFIPGTLMVYCLFYFLMVFPRRSAYFTPTLFWLTMLPMLLFLALMIYDHRWIISEVVLENGVRSPIFGLGYMFYTLYALGLNLGGAINQWLNFQLATRRERAQMFYFLIGALLSVTGFTLTNLLLPWTVTAALSWMGAWFTLIFVGFTVYAITKHQLMDISVVISRTVAELLSILIMGGLYLIIVWCQLTFIGPTIDPVFLTLTVLFGIFVGQAHLPLRLFLQTTSEKIFLHGKYDYYNALAAASSRVVEKLSLPEILKVLYETFADVMELSQPRIMLPDQFSEPDKASTGYVVYHREDYRPEEGGERFGLDDKLIKTLITTRAPRVTPNDPDHALIVPCLLEARLIALFVFGPKLSEDPYTEEDLRLLQALASQAAVALDHTHSYERIRSDLEVVERQLERSQRLASLGTLTAGVTHEIRNPLTVIRGETERLANQERDLEYLKNFRDLLLKHIDRIGGIVERMLGLAKEKQKRETAVDLNELIEATVPLCELPQIEVRSELGEISRVKGDPEELQEVFVNLIQNASEAMGGKGALTIKTFNDDQQVVVEVSDTGKGIPEEIREKIFDPFYSTRHEGVGLGLSIVYRIVREHGGDIKVSSEVGKGTTFRLSFAAA
ncbi:MAG: ATP-binding protein [Candidatus Margulisbacteria bacterium]|jgi:signal transduction histidine kinase|nr:ATP-binding protein [Candidatus Margulisiibacteriota bacterium]